MVLLSGCVDVTSDGWRQVNRFWFVSAIWKLLSLEIIVEGLNADSECS